VLVAESGEQVTELLAELTPARARAIGDAARRRLLEQHTYAHRAEQVEAVLAGAPA
jgi:spore maturation protein CgeB